MEMGGVRMMLGRAMVEVIAEIIADFFAGIVAGIGKPGNIATSSKLSGIAVFAGDLTV